MKLLYSVVVQIQNPKEYFNRKHSPPTTIQCAQFAEFRNSVPLYKAIWICLLKNVSHFILLFKEFPFIDIGYLTLLTWDAFIGTIPISSGSAYFWCYNLQCQLFIGSAKVLFFLMWKPAKKKNVSLLISCQIIHCRHEKKKEAGSSAILKMRYFRFRFVVSNFVFTSLNNKINYDRICLPFQLVIVNKIVITTVNVL